MRRRYSCEARAHLPVVAVPLPFPPANSFSSGDGAECSRICTWSDGFGRYQPRVRTAACESDAHALSERLAVRSRSTPGAFVVVATRWYPCAGAAVAEVCRLPRHRITSGVRLVVISVQCSRSTPRPKADSWGKEGISLA